MTHPPTPPRRAAGSALLALLLLAPLAGPAAAAPCANERLGTQQDRAQTLREYTGGLRRLVERVGAGREPETTASLGPRPGRPAPPAPARVADGWALFQNGLQAARLARDPREEAISLSRATNLLADLGDDLLAFALIDAAGPQPRLGADGAGTVALGLAMTRGFLTQSLECAIRGIR